LPAPQFTTDASFFRQPPLGRSESLAGRKIGRQFALMNADRSHDRTALSDAARVREMAGLLALAVNRLMQRKSTEEVEPVALKGVDGSAIPSMCATSPSSTREAA
jgi:hypothetical protein